MSSENPPAPDLNHPRTQPVARWLVGAALGFFIFNTNIGATWRLADVLKYEVPGSGALLAGHSWTLLTYALMGMGAATPADWLWGPLSIFCLYFFAKLVETDLPPRQFLLLCTGCALAGSVAWLPWHWHTGEPLLCGCTALVFGLLSYWLNIAPDELLPVPVVFIKMQRKVFFCVLLALTTGAFLALELPQLLGWHELLHNRIYSSALLGALLAGWAFAYYWSQTTPLGPWENSPVVADATPRRWLEKAPVGAARAGATNEGRKDFKAQSANRRELREEVDRILDKINQGGLTALSPEERHTLAKAREYLKK